MKMIPTTSDAILIGAGIMSTTLGVLLKELDPTSKITIFEQLEGPGKESSNELNNSGTGHAALCEMNYTIEQPDGTIDMEAAIRINERFQLSRQFWSYLVDHNYIGKPSDFITSLPHISFVKGQRDIDFLKKRFDTMTKHPLFKQMVYSEDPDTLSEWFPLMMKDRSPEEPVAATKIADGTDINYGALTRAMAAHLEEENVAIHYNSNVKDIKRNEAGLWEVTIQKDDHLIETHTAKFVFIGAGGKSLPLLQKSLIPEGKHIGGFPISGQYLECNNPEVIAQHDAKVYGKNPDGAPKLVVPHLDSRTIHGERTLIFGPFAGFSPKFLKTGSNKDLFASIKPNNLITMMASGVKNVSLIQYLIQQLSLSKKARMKELREFFPDAKDEDWELKVGGQRVQVIRDTDESRGIIHFSDTEVVRSEDGSLAALLGGSPGASTSVSDMIRVLENCFPEKMQDWQPKLKNMIPSYGETLTDKPELVDEIQSWTAASLGLK